MARPVNRRSRIGATGTIRELDPCHPLETGNYSVAFVDWDDGERDGWRYEGFSGCVSLLESLDLIPPDDRASSYVSELLDRCKQGEGVPA